MRYLLFISFLLFSSSSFAKLGDFKYNSENNQSSDLSSYRTLTAQLDNSNVTEYINSSNQVFEVTWTGTFHPSMNQIVGSQYLRDYDQKEKSARVKGQRNSVTVKDTNLVIKKSGHMGNLHGRAYDPTLVPAGVNANELP